MIWSCECGLLRSLQWKWAKGSVTYSLSQHGFLPFICFSLFFFLLVGILYKFVPFRRPVERLGVSITGRSIQFSSASSISISWQLPRETELTEGDCSCGHPPTSDQVQFHSAWGHRRPQRTMSTFETVKTYETRIWSKSFFFWLFSTIPFLALCWRPHQFE